MKRFSFLVFLFYSLHLSAQVKFDDFFISKTLRVDYFHSGNLITDMICFEQMKQEAFWGGSKKNLVDIFDYGNYKFSVCDSSSNKEIYSRGFCSLFQEWQNTDEAKKINRSFYECVVFPFPKKTVKLEIFSKDKYMKLTKIFEMYINPNNYFIKKENPLRYASYKIFDSGDPSVKVDVVIIPDGYAKEDLEKLKKDAKRFAGYLFNHAPFKENKEKFNIWLVEAFSQESGTDIAGQHVWKNTIVNSNFYTFDSDRYLTTSDIKSVRDLAGLVPYDQIFIMVNSTKYGGGGVYNAFSMCSSDNEHAEVVFIHEFGHAFGGLGDEYYDSDVAVQDYYKKEVEPWEPNLTTLVNFDKKWKNMLDKETPIPTPNTDNYKDKVGAFEGGGYMPKGMYRPYINCEMKSLYSGFCPVCQKALKDMIDFCTK
ncbi:MAG: peptidase M64 [Bacteroidetes bacterium RIFOXYA12_FULL_35_11]|nr:MAG: peptidase M64 [Bacteroidetes bacterium GWF2_35_48]OFY78840.1 MAG: peptidase M64 [Bacteroidetes bacterium RIFOXYA12_FULL_35_11]HBX50314.1 peptidase M64 [Bacteroidales bacterium]